MTIKEAAIDRKNNLNLIRLIASLMVVYMHSFAICLGEQSQDIFYTLSNHKALAGGIAVYIFFIISGFLICRSYDRSKSVFAYFKARFLRIWPLLFVVVMATAFILGPILTVYSTEEYFKGDIAGFLKNIFFLSDVTTLPGVYSDHYNHSLNGSLWTLMFEVIWYVLVALLSPLWKKYKSTSVALFIALTGLYLIYTYGGVGDIGPVSSAFIINFAKLGMFFSVGMIFYLFSDKILLSYKIFIAEIIILILGIIFADFIIIFACAGSYIIFYLAFQKRFIATWYDRIGDLSYGIYIMAFPIQQTLVEYLGEPTYGYNTLSMNPYINMGLTLLILVPLAMISWHFIESPCLRLKNRNKVVD